MRARKRTAAPGGPRGGGKISNAVDKKSLTKTAAEVQPLVAPAEAALAFLAWLDPKAKGFTFQTFDDRGEDGGLARVLHGTLKKHAVELGELNWGGAGVFVTINQTDGAGRRTENITRVRAVFVDLDGAPIDPVMKGELKPHLVVETSPEKYHAYWSVTGLTLDAFEDLQRGIANKFDGDPAVHDLPRVMRLPGYLHRKGEPFETRILETHDAPPYPAAEILAAFPAPAATADRQEAEGDGADHGPIPKGRRDYTLTSAAGALRRHGANYKEIYAHLRVINRERCEPPLPDKDLRKIAKSVCRYPPVPHLTDAGNAERLVARHGADLLYSHAWKTWLIWDARRFKVDEAGRAVTLAKDTATAIYHEAATAAEAGKHDLAKVVGKWAATSQQGPRLREMLWAAQDLRAVDPTVLDADDDVLNLKNGTLDLRTGELCPHDRADRITRLAPVTYDRAAECSRWEAFLRTVLAGDDELIAFVQRAVGYTLTGNTSEHVLLLLHGLGANGKTTFLETMLALLGDYGRRTAFTTLLSRGRFGGGGPRNDIAALVGARLVTASEADPGQRLDEALIKDITGGDTISVRELYQRLFEFKPRFKLWLATNSKPVIRGADEGIWRRILLVPFEVTIPVEERDRDLPRKLREELSGILNWAIAGLRAWREDGLQPPEQVLKATDEYRTDMDLLADFITERCEVSRDEKPWPFTPSRAISQAHHVWCETRGEKPVAMRTLGRMLEERGFPGGYEVIKGRRTRVRYGLLLTFGG